MRERGLFAKRAGQIRHAKTSDMRALAARLQAQGRSIINLAAGELDDDTSGFIKQAAIDAVRRGTNKYTDTIGTPALRDALARRMASQAGLPWSANEIAVTAGAKQALFNTAMVLFDEGDEVIVPSPHWTTFPAQITLTGARPVFVDTSKDDYDLRADRIAAALTPRTKAIIVNTPNNPTGRLVSTETIREIARLARERDVWVIFDQCYATFVYGEEQQSNILRLAPSLRERAVTIDSFSKSHALAGWRIGYLAGPAALVKAVSTLQSHTTSNPNALAQAVALALLERPAEDDLRAVKQELSSRRLLTLDVLSSIDGVRVVQPQGGFYVYLDMKKKLRHLVHAETNADWLPEYILEKAGVAIVGGDAFGDSSGIRLSYAVAADTLKEGLVRLTACLRDLSGELSR
jgi:aspartate aminotransferase